MIKLHCCSANPDPADCIKAEPLSNHGDVMVSIVEVSFERRDERDDAPCAVFLSPEKARALGLELIRMAGGAYTE